MMQTFQVQNVRCGGCASTLRTALEEYGEVKVNLMVTPREITLDVDDEQMEDLKMKLRSVGYPLVGDDLNMLQTVQTKATSFVSCAIGKMDKE